ncbi:MAG: Na/Pi symporter [Cyclobacteriaceae bacterium]|nr:Na/Pi symporter [Cyclobacteriaceae bacterium]
MFKNFLFVVVLVGLALIFWISPNMQDIAAGVAILLFGMILLEKGFNSMAEGPLKKILAKTTNKFYKSFLLGVTSTTLLQSSSLISVITISFLSAGLLTLYQGIGIIFGANLGSTSTAWLIAVLGLKLDIAAFSMPFIVFGVIFQLRHRPILKGIGNVLLGLGFFFLGIGLMKTGFDTYQGAINLSALTEASPWSHAILLFAGIFITVILQSSGASMALVISALSAGQITYEDALTLAIGANVGTTVTAIVGALTANADGKRIAAAHLIFNMLTGIIAMSLLPQLIWLVDRSSEFCGINSLDYTLKLAMFHTMFNMLGIIVLSPFSKLLVVLLVKLIRTQGQLPDKPEFLNDAALAYPQTALQVMLKETRHLSGLCYEAMIRGLGKEIQTNGKRDQSIRVSSAEVLDEFYYTRIKNLYGEIIQFGIKAQKNHGDPAYIVAVNNVMESCRYFIESLKDIKDISANVLKYVDSDNEVMRKEYIKIRNRISRFAQIVMLYNAEKSSLTGGQKDGGQILEKLNAKRQALADYLAGLKARDVLFNGSLNQFIQDKTLNSQMVTSLINDYRISYSISKHLLKAAELLYLNPALLMEEIGEKTS